MRRESRTRLRPGGYDAAREDEDEEDDGEPGNQERQPEKNQPLAADLAGLARRRARSCLHAGYTGVILAS